MDKQLKRIAWEAILAAAGLDPADAPNFEPDDLELHHDDLCLTQVVSGTLRSRTRGREEWTATIDIEKWACSSTRAQAVTAERDYLAEATRAGIAINFGRPGWLDELKAHFSTPTPSAA